MTTPYSNPLHLYRALLRESTYLFHPAAQQFHGRHITWSFRRQQANAVGSKVRCAEDGRLPLPSKDESQQMRRGRRYLYMLQRANQGYTSAVLNVLNMTFARTGKGRRELLKEIMAPEPADPMAPDQGAPSITTYSRGWKPPAKFTTLLKSQSRVQSHLEVAGKIRLQPKIPETNRWNRPFPASRVKNMMRKWYTKHAAMLRPPLQEQEWLDLYKPATNTDQPKWNVPKRRPQGSVPVCEGTTNHLELFDLSNLVKTSPQAIKPQQSRRISALLGNPHHLKPRYMRRMMQRTLQQTPTPIADPEKGRIALRWESGMEPRRQPTVCTDSQKITLFD